MSARLLRRLRLYIAMRRAEMSHEGSWLAARGEPLMRQAKDPLIGAVLRLPTGDCAEVLDIEHEFDDGTTLRYLSGRHSGNLTQRDTFAIRRYEVVRDWPMSALPGGPYKPAVALRAPRHWPRAQWLYDWLTKVPR